MYDGILEKINAAQCGIYNMSSLICKDAESGLVIEE